MLSTDQLRHALIFACAFIAFTVIGTISHELGHIGVARTLGYQTTLHYGSMNWDRTTESDSLKASCSGWNSNETTLSETEREQCRKQYYELWRNAVFISAGGPLQTMLTGSIGFLILLLRRRVFMIPEFGFQDWTWVFLSFFWLRQVFNPVYALASRGVEPQFTLRGDEANIAFALDWPVWSLPIGLGIIGLILVLYVIFRLIPMRFRKPLLVGGFIGGGFGYWLWMYVLGPVLLP
jgi:hypothetical protein